MDLQNTPMTVQLGREVRIQLTNAIINTGNAGATIQFGSLDFPTVAARAATASLQGVDSEGSTRRPCCTEAATHHAYLPAQQHAVENPQRRISIFEPLSQPEAPTTKRVVTSGRISMVTANTTTLPTGLSAPRRNVAEAFSSGKKLIRRQRRKLNAELRAQQQLLPVHLSNLPTQEPEATIPIQNRWKIGTELWKSRFEVWKSRSMPRKSGSIPWNIVLWLG